MKEYTKDGLTVIWKPEQCFHSRKCFNGLQEVFNPAQRPWVNMEAASKERIMQQVEQCPSGALSYLLEKQESMSPETVSTEKAIVEVMPNGPLLVYGNLDIKHKDGTAEHKTKVTAFCRCGQSANKPYCDGTHARNGFRDE
ncbi:MAG: (4Fe-4S)-binding protein [Flavipsychrobacter sp.]|nr:(4Fe-4S)-binding protein [Flavipsychrobacter sp.]